MLQAFFLLLFAGLGPIALKGKEQLARVYELCPNGVQTPDPISLEFKETENIAV
jgi:hypothetical protein